MLLAVGAANPDCVTVQSAGQVSRDKVTLMSAVDLAALLSQMEHMG